MLTDTFKF